MTLAQLGKLYPQSYQRPAGLSWLSDEVKIELFWTGEDAIALGWLLDESFKIDGDGLISLTGLIPAKMEFPARLAVHQGIIKSFLQHGGSRKSTDSTTVISIDDKDLQISYKKLTSYVHQKFTKDLCNRKGRLQTQPIGIKGWLYPGASVRHIVDEKSTIFREPPELALALLFAPLACQFFFLPNQEGFFSNLRIVVVIPAITNLVEAAKSCLSMVRVNYQDRCILHPQEAGWRFFERDRQLNKSGSARITTCQIVTFQAEVWAKQLKLRSQVEVVEVRDDILDRYQQLTAKLSTNRVVTTKNEEHFLVATKIHNLIVVNIVVGSPFFKGLSQIVTDPNWALL